MKELIYIKMIQQLLLVAISGCKIHCNTMKEIMKDSKI